MEKHWLLYTDEKQTKLLAGCDEEDCIEFESQYYSDGCWFEYDIEVSKKGSVFLINERKYKGFVLFPSEPNERPKFGEDDYNQAWSAMKKVTAGIEIR
jgi:hypothetical protein